jgi:hypothetical protein
MTVDDGVAFICSLPADATKAVADHEFLEGVADFACLTFHLRYYKFRSARRQGSPSSQYY